MSYRLCALPSWPSSLISLHSLLEQGGLEMLSFACELVPVVVRDCRQKDASVLVSGHQFKDLAFIGLVEKEFILFIKYQ